MKGYETQITQPNNRTFTYFQTQRVNLVLFRALWVFTQSNDAAGFFRIGVATTPCDWQRKDSGSRFSGDPQKMRG